MTDRCERALIFYVVWIGLWLLSPIALADDEINLSIPKPDCGVLAAEAVLRSFDVDLRHKTEFNRLCRQAPLSLLDLETLFDDEGLRVTAFRLSDAPKA